MIAATDIDETNALADIAGKDTCKIKVSRINK
jgi:hypothetical protein